MSGWHERLAVRLDRLREAMQSEGLEAIYTDDLSEVRWISGFTGSHGAVLVTHTQAHIATDGRYDQQVRSESPTMAVVIGRHLPALLGAIAAREGVAVHVSPHRTTVSVLRALESESATVTPEGTPIGRLRQIKDAGEMAALREACRLTDAALLDIAYGPVTGVTERELAVRLERRMVDLGAEAPAFATIVAAGPHSAIPHHQPTHRVIATGDLLKIDFGARVDGYHADMTRTFIIGSPEGWQQEIHEVVHRAQQAGVAAARAGVPAVDVDRAARSIIEQAGYAEYFTHGLGHGVGLDIHEEPYLGATATATLSAGSAITVEPGIYLPGRGGVRIEDTLVVGEHGAQSLTVAPRDLVSLG